MCENLGFKIFHGVCGTIGAMAELYFHSEFYESADGEGGLDSHWDIDEETPDLRLVLDSLAGTSGASRSVAVEALGRLIGTKLDDAELTEIRQL